MKADVYKLADSIKRHSIDIGGSVADGEVIWCKCGLRFLSEDQWSRHVAEHVALDLEKQ